jgi:hypothetical protein
MQADSRQLFFYKSILNSFSESIDLKVNYAKFMVPIHVSTGMPPFTYLAFPLSLTKPSVAGFEKVKEDRVLPHLS